MVCLFFILNVTLTKKYSKQADKKVTEKIEILSWKDLPFDYIWSLRKAREILFIWRRKNVKRYKYLSLETFENKFLICHLWQISVHSNLSLGIKKNFARFTNSTIREFSYQQMLICHTFENRAILNFSNINQPFPFFALPISSWHQLKCTAFLFSLHIATILPEVYTVSISDENMGIFQYFSLYKNYSI